MPIMHTNLLKGDVALDIITHGPHMNLCDLIACLDNNFGVMSNEDTLMKELYTIKQGTKESVKCFDTRIGYVRMRLAAAFPACHAHGAGQKKPERPTFLAGYVLTSSLPWPGKCA